MKILFFAKNFYTPQFYGGMEKYLYTLVRKLRNRHQISLFIPLQYNYSIKGVKIYHWMFTNVPILDTCTTVLSIALVAPVIFLRERPQIISGFIPSFATTTFFALAKLFGIKTIINFRGTGNKYLAIVRFLENCTFLFSDGIIMNAKSLSKAYRQSTPLLSLFYAKIPCYYIPNAVDSEFWAPISEKTPTTHDLVFIANLTNSTRIEKKGLTVLYDALNLIKENYGMVVKTMMIGRNRKSIIVRKIGTFESEYFDWRGNISDQKMLRDTIAKAKIFVLSSSVEGMPNSLMETMAAGLPAVATDVGGVRDLIMEGKNGFIVPVNDARSLAEAIWRLLNTPKLQILFSATGREHMIKNFSWSTNISRVEDVYHRIIHHNRLERN
jgi:glycosyltransferase involved in cell wall biosynthesis